jgi:CheY-like chemotaxis protein
MIETSDLVVLIAEHDPGHSRLIEKSLARIGLGKTIQRFGDGQSVLDFLLCDGPERPCAYTHPYLLLLDIGLPGVDGIEVLRQLKDHRALRKMPVIMLTTTSDPQELDRCYRIGCNGYIVKPIGLEAFSDAIDKIGKFLSLIRVPHLLGTDVFS